METAERTLRILVSHNQYVLFDTDAEPPLQTIDEVLAGNGLVTVNAEGTYASVLTGTSHGHVDVTFTVHDTEPPLDTEAWDEVIEVSLFFSGQGPMVGGPVTDDVEDVPLLGGEDEYRWWRFRIHARGRDTASALGGVDADAGDQVVEQHRIQIWLAPRQEETRHKLTDQTGQRTRTADPQYYAQAKAAESPEDA